MIRQLAALCLISLAAAPVLQAQPTRPVGGFLGILAEPSGPGTGNGVLVRQVVPGGPADRAGLQPGDQIVKIGDKAIRDYDELANAVSEHKPGDQLTLHIMREGKEQNVQLTLGERRPQEGERRPQEPGGQPPAMAFLGVQSRPLRPSDRQELGVGVDSGAVVVDVTPGTPAEAADLRRGDVITAVDNTTVTNPEDLREAVRRAGAGKEVNLHVARRNETLQLHAKLGESGSEGMMPAPMMPGPGRMSGGRIGDMERRIQDLEKRVNELERRQPPPTK
jgi:S1-C subfamily serine protease